MVCSSVFQKNLEIVMHQFRLHGTKLKIYKNRLVGPEMCIRRILNRYIRISDVWNPLLKVMGQNLLFPKTDLEALECRLDDFVLSYVLLKSKTQIYPISRPEENLQSSEKLTGRSWILHRMNFYCYRHVTNLWNPYILKFKVNGQISFFFVKIDV